MARLDERALRYGEFYGALPVVDDTRPLWVVYGGIQAEGLRALLSQRIDAPYRTVRIPAADELQASDRPYLARTLQDCSVLISLPDPVVPGDPAPGPGLRTIRTYLHPAARVLTVPPVTYVGLHPFLAAPSQLEPVPPLVPYHDLRTAAAAVGLRARHPDVPGESPALTRSSPVTWLPSRIRITRLAAWSLAVLQTTERPLDVRVSDLLRIAGRNAMDIVDRPGSEVLAMVARRVQTALGAEGTVLAPADPVLPGPCAPIAAEVLEAIGVCGEPRDLWHVGVSRWTPEEVDEVHRGWYMTHPEVPYRVLRRERLRLGVLGMLW